MANGWQLATGNWQVAMWVTWKLDCVSENAIRLRRSGLEWSAREAPFNRCHMEGKAIPQTEAREESKKKNHQAVKLMSTTSCRQVCPVVKQKYKKNGKKPKKMNEIFRMMSILNCYKY